MSTASCSDYRAGSTIDLEHDAADITTKVTCPLLALWAEHGIMTTLFDIPAEWRKRCTDVSAATVPGGHFFLDQQPEATARILGDFFERRTQELATPGPWSGLKTRRRGSCCPTSPRAMPIRSTADSGTGKVC